MIFFSLQRFSKSLSSVLLGISAKSSTTSDILISFFFLISFIFILVSPLVPNKKLNPDYENYIFDTDFEINPGDRIAQMIIVPVIQADFEIVDEFNETQRGEKGFGSSGIN